MSASAPPETEYLHATAVVVGETGILIRGASGSGKSTLARDVLREADRAGRFARLVGDDRIRVTPRHGRLIARPHPDIAGLLEIRGLGLVRVPHEPKVVVRLVVDCEADPARFPAANASATLIAGIALPRIAVNGPLGAGVVFFGLEAYVTRS